MTEWWEPLNLKMQNDQPFDETHYMLKNNPKNKE